jgi:dihydrofolate reductase
MNVSLDGYATGPKGSMDWLLPTVGDDQMAWMVRFLREEADILACGKVDYLKQAEVWPAVEGELAAALNSMPKVVFSTTLTDLVWNNSRLATGSTAEEIARLKQESGKDIYVSGGPSFAQSLVRENLVDEYNLFVQPLLLGSGLPLFADVPELRLKLVSTRTFDSGTVLHVHQPV